MCVLCNHGKSCKLWVLVGKDAASLGVCLCLEVSKGCGSVKNLSLRLLVLEERGTMLLQSGGSHLPADTVSLIRGT